MSAGEILSIQAFGKKRPKIDPTAFVYERAVIIGDVKIDAGCSIWPNAVIRGDVQPIRIGENTNIQDNVVIHTSSDSEAPVIIGKNVSVGHGAILHGCTIGDNCVIGMQSVILDNAKIESWVLIGAGAVVPSNVNIPTKSLALGVPAKVIRQLNNSDLKYIEENAKSYLRLAAAYQKRQT